MRAMQLFIVADEWGPLGGLEEMLGARGHRLERRAHDEEPEALTGFDAGFVYVHRPLPPALEARLVQYVERGGRLVALHHALASAKIQNPRWMHLAGMHIEPRDAPRHAWRVVGTTTHWLVNLCPGHPITTDGVVYDRDVQYVSSDAPSRPGTLPALELPQTEVFVNQHFTGDRNRIVLFGSMCVDPDTGETVMQDRGGWIRRVGPGMLIYLQPGHTAADFRHPAYRRILANCLTWDGRS